MRRLLFLAAILPALTASAIAYAAAGRRLAAAAPATTTARAGIPTVLVVPDLHREAFVFAKQQLQDDGFAWKVIGGVRGYPANTVISQSPAPGTKLVDTGAPLITLTLQRNKQYAPLGEPQNTSPYSPTKNRLAGSS
jgi:beta-lactam-binding protein with PASTA domain